MCNNGWGGGNCCWIIILLIIIFCCCGNSWGGCNGGCQGIAAMSEGRPASEIIKTVRGLVCRNKQSGSSCADQLAMGLQQALMIIHGSPCPGCDTGVCVNAK